jgi:hypothetical protein
VRGIDVLHHQRDLLGDVASASTLSRALAEMDQAGLERVDTARAAVRARVWDLIVARHGQIPRPWCPAVIWAPRSCYASTRTSSTRTPAKRTPGGLLIC